MKNNGGIYQAYVVLSSVWIHTPNSKTLIVFNAEVPSRPKKKNPCLRRQITFLPN